MSRHHVLLTPDFPPDLGGIATYLFSIYDGLAPLAVVAPRRPGCHEFDSAREYTACRLPTLQGVPWLRGCSYLVQSYRAVRRLLEGGRDGQETGAPLILHCGHVHAAFLARRLKRRYGVPYLVWTYALEVTDRWLRRPIRAVLRDADLILTDSDYTRRSVERLGADASRVIRVRPGTDPNRFSPGVDRGRWAARLQLEDQPVLLTVATISRHQRYKGQDMVIRALPEVLRRVPDLLYVIAGGGNDVRYLEELAERVGVRNRVRLVGRVAEEELPGLYACASAFALCSREQHCARGTLAEGFGIVLLEAGASGKPVIGGLSGGIPDAVRDGVTGLLVDPTSPAAIAAAIVRVLTEPGLAARLGGGGREWAVREMNWERARNEFRAALARTFDLPLPAALAPKPERSR
jgi:phosphatidylinositol alpha-1,6-mannosyltransferase